MSKLKESKNFKVSKTKSTLFIERYFKFSDFKTTMRKEIVGGLSTFLAMVYILSLIPSKLSGISDYGEFGLFLATAIVAFASTFMMGLIANVPITVAPSLGVLSLVISTATKDAIGLNGTLIAIMFASIMVTIISITPLRTMIIAAMPKSLNIAIGVGIGMFIAYIGLSDIGFVDIDTTSHLPIASISNLKVTYPGILLGVATLCLTLFLYFKKINGAVIIALLAAFIIAVMIANIGTNLSVSNGDGVFASANFKENGGWTYHFGEFSSNIKETWSAFSKASMWKNPTFYISIFLFVFLNFFDATGTLITFNEIINKATGNNLPVSKKAMVVDSASSIFSSAIGMTATTTTLESGAGIQQGARTGFASIISSFGFLAAIALFPIFKAIPSCASGAAIMFVGILMFSNAADIEWKKPEFAISTFFMIIFMVVTYSTVNGIVVGIIAYAFIMLITGKRKEVNPIIWILTLLFIAYFVGLAFSN